MTTAQTLLHNVYLFKELAQRELEVVHQAAKVESFGPGDEIFCEGDVAHSLYVLKFGTVRVEHSGHEDRVEIATLGTGSHFGEVAFLDHEKRSATVTVVEKAELVMLDFVALLAILEAHPPIALKVYKAMALYLCGRLRVTTTDLTFAREKNMRHT